MIPRYIIIHHSATEDGETADWPAIRRYHTSWRYKGLILTPERARELIQAGKVGVEAPWRDIGYHFGVELVADKYVIQTGRPVTQEGAHCKEGGMNRQSLGVCMVGNYDVDELPDAARRLLADLVSSQLRQFSIPVENVKKHHDYAAYKTCPGSRFPWGELIENLKEQQA